MFETGVKNGIMVGGMVRREVFPDPRFSKLFQK